MSAENVRLWTPFSWHFDFVISLKREQTLWPIKELHSLSAAIEFYAQGEVCY